MRACWVIAAQRGTLHVQGRKWDRDRRLNSLWLHFELISRTALSLAQRDMIHDFAIDTRLPECAMSIDADRHASLRDYTLCQRTREVVVNIQQTSNL
jgi:hypothetical protein